MTIPVVIVHGLWLRGYEFFLLRNRLAAAGFAPSIFQYRSMQDSFRDVNAALAARLRSFDGPVHVVAHSLGGVIAVETYASERDLPPGRVVLLGAPVQGSRAARGVARFAWGSPLLGPLALAELCRSRDRRWQSDREIGIIAGSRPLGLGRVFATLPQPNDGSVCVDETQLPGAMAHLVLDVNHLGMLVSRGVADEIGTFLASGRFAASSRN